MLGASSRPTPKKLPLIHRKTIKGTETAGKTTTDKTNKAKRVSPIRNRTNNSQARPRSRKESGSLKELNRKNPLIQMSCLLLTSLTKPHTLNPNANNDHATEATRTTRTQLQLLLKIKLNQNSIQTQVSTTRARIMQRNRNQPLLKQIERCTKLLKKLLMKCEKVVEVELTVLKPHVAKIIVKSVVEVGKTMTIIRKIRTMIKIQKTKIWRKLQRLKKVRKIQQLGVEVVEEAIIEEAEVIIEEVEVSIRVNLKSLKIRGTKWTRRMRTDGGTGVKRKTKTFLKSKKKQLRKNKQ